MIWVFIKAIFFFSIAIALAVAFNFVKDADGTLTIDFLNRAYQLSFISFFALILALLFLALMINIALKFLWSLIGFLRGDDTALKRFFERRSERKGQSFLISASQDLCQTYYLLVHMRLTETYLSKKRYFRN